MRGRTRRPARRTVTMSGGASLIGIVDSVDNVAHALNCNADVLEDLLKEVEYLQARVEELERNVAKDEVK